MLTARKGISGLGRGPNTGAHGGVTLRRLLYRRSGLLKDNRRLEKEGLSEEERLSEEKRLPDEDGFLKREDGLLDRDRLWDERLNHRDRLLRGGGRRDWLWYTRAYSGGGAPAEYLLHLASAWNASGARDRPDRPRLEFDCRHPGAFVLVGLFGGGFLLGDANGDFLPFGDLLLNGSGLLLCNGLLLLHVCGLWRFGALLVSRTKEGLAGPGDEQDEQEQGDEGHHDPPNDVDASSGLLAYLHRFYPISLACP